MDYSLLCLIVGTISALQFINLLLARYIVFRAIVISTFPEMAVY